MADFRTGNLFFLIMKLTMLKHGLECLGSGESIDMTSQEEEYIILIGCRRYDMRVDKILCHWEAWVIFWIQPMTFRDTCCGDVLETAWSMRFKDKLFPYFSLFPFNSVSLFILASFHLWTWFSLEKEEIILAEVDILTEEAQINEIIVTFIKVRSYYFRRFDEDGSSRSCWSSVSSVATSESPAGISFSSRVRETSLSLVDCGVHCAVYSEAKVVVRSEINLN